MTRHGRLAAVVGGSGSHECGICGQDTGQALVLEYKSRINGHDSHELLAMRMMIAVKRNITITGCGYYELTIGKLINISVFD